MIKIKDSNERQSELHEGAEAGKFCKRQSLEAKLGIAVKCDRARHESRLPLIKKDWFIPVLFNCYINNLVFKLVSDYI